MIQKIQKLKRRGGFTLVELIVVLVILAILASLLVPALVGYIDEAKTRQYISYARHVLMATQSVLDEMFAENVKISEMTSENRQEVLDLIDNTGLNDVGFIFLLSNASNNSKRGETITAEAYVIKAAAYIYQVNEGGIYTVLLYDYDSKSWSKLGEADAMGQRYYMGARGLFYKYYVGKNEEYPNFTENHSQYYIHIEGGE